MKILKLFKKIKGFTLVELIVVIGIVSILAVVGGLTVTQFVGDGRDARVKADLTNIAKGINIYHVENGEYPKPENYTGDTVRQGEWGSGNTEDVLFEPHSKQSDGTNFIYTVTADQQNYSIAGWIDGEEEITYNNLIGEKVYAAGRNYKGMKLFKIGNIDIPIIVNRNTWEPVNKSNYGDFGSYEGLNKETETATYSDGAEELSGSNLTEMLTKSEEYLEENGTIIGSGDDEGSGEETEVLYNSCKDIQQNNASNGDGVYKIDPNGDGSGFEVYCDMNMVGGPWTLVGSYSSDRTSGFEKSSIVGPTDTKEILDDNLWTEIRDSSEYIMMTTNNEPGYVRSLISDGKQANCQNLSTLEPGIDGGRTYYARKEEGCSISGIDYCYIKGDSTEIKGDNRCGTSYIETSSDGNSWSMPSSYTSYSVQNLSKIWVLVK